MVCSLLSVPSLMVVEAMEILSIMQWPISVKQSPCVRMNRMSVILELHSLASATLKWLFDGYLSIYIIQ